MPTYTYIDRTTGKIGYQSMTPLAVDASGNIAVRVTLPNGHPGTYSEGMNDGSVRRGTRGPGSQQVAGEPFGGGGANLPTIASSDWELP